MKLLLKSLVTGLFLFFCANGLFGQSAAEISRKSREVIDLGSTQMDFTIYIRDNKGNERVRQLTMISAVFNDVGKTLVRFTAPSDVQGTTLLIYDNKDKEDDMWIYMPSLKKVRRIISSERGKSFMGSEFTNADMSKPNQ
ncbi:MAG TPA: outer membrane lipoprotein-sorting protein, partial [Bacteroidales bacterium]|nr:outer membrane lipoprotein-sorting protein [Bacteroidales bacterium]